MKFRLKFFALHLLTSVCILALVWGALYLGWYRWPGWYVSGALGIAGIMAMVDVVLGPSLTLFIANPNKERTELFRDISFIGGAQLVALIYGAFTLWHGRPLYYTYSEGFLEMIQAGDFNPAQVALGEQLNPQFAPHWYSTPRWVYAPLPKDEQTANKIVQSSVAGGDDVTQMPRYYRPWEEALPQMLKNRQVASRMAGLGPSDQKIAAQRVKELGLDAEQPQVLPMLGRHSKPLVAVIDSATGQIKTWIRVD
jgi:hypothetical protein